MFGKFITSACILLTATMVNAQTGKMTIAVSATEATPTLKTAMTNKGKGQSLARVIEAFDGQMIDVLTGTRKFQVVGRSDLKHQQDELDLTLSGIVDAGDKNAAQAAKVAGAKYMIVTKLDDFEDSTERMDFQQLGKVGLKRKVRLSAVAKIYDTSSLKVLETMSTSLIKKEDRMDDKSLESNSELTDELLQKTVREFCKKVAYRVTDVLTPATVVSKRDKVITINRGDGTDIAIGQVWEIFAVGEEIFDPVTGESLGKEEASIGKARITSVQPLKSTAEVLEDNGTQVGAILRLPQVATQPVK